VINFDEVVVAATGCHISSLPEISEKLRGGGRVTAPRPLPMLQPCGRNAIYVSLYG